MLGFGTDGNETRLAGAVAGALGAGEEGDVAPNGVDSSAAEAAPMATIEGDATANVDRAVAAAVAAEVPLNLGEYSGIVLRAIGDGKKYTAVLRTSDYARDGLEYHLDFKSSTKSFASVRLPFSNFIPVRRGRRAPDAPELDRRRLATLGLSFYPQRNDPSFSTGEFYLSVANVKAYRKRDEPEFVYISDAAVEAHSLEALETTPARVRTKLLGERMLKSSGLTYFIVRPTELTDDPSSRRLSFTQARARAARCPHRHLAAFLPRVSPVPLLLTPFAPRADA